MYVWSWSDMIDRVRSEDSAMANASRSLSSIIDDAAASLGYTRLKVEQKKALQAFVGGKDVFVSLPTFKCMKPKHLSVTASTHVSSLEFLSVEQELTSVRARKRFHSISGKLSQGRTDVFAR